MQSTVKLYNAPEIIPSRLFIIDDIETYLATLTNTQTITKFQYIKQGLKISIKIDKNQTSLDPLSASNLWNYCSIQNYIDDQNEEKIYYYFVMNKRWIASSTLELDLELDSINTFRPSTSFTIKDQTTINRMHKDRFIAVSDFTKTFTISGTGTLVNEGGGIYRSTNTFFNSEWIGTGILLDEYTVNVIAPTGVDIVSGYPILDNTDGSISIQFGGSSAITYSFDITVSIYYPDRYLRNIDINSEGITPVLFGENLGEISGDNNNWYLTYKGSSDIVMHLVPEYPVTVNVAGDDNIAPSDLTTGTHYFIMEDRTSGDSRITAIITTDIDTVYKVQYRANHYGTNQRCCVEFYTNASKIYIRSIFYYIAFGGWYFLDSTEWEECNSLTISGTSSLESHTLASSTTSLTAIYGGSIYTFTISATSGSISTIGAVNRTSDTTLLKVIKLPYPVIDTGDLSPEWSLDSTFLQGKPTIELHSTVEHSTNPLNELNIDLSSIALTNLKNVNYESKLFHSDYYQNKFIYDSFVKIFALERINLDTYNIFDGTPFIFEFAATNTVNSRFLFTFTQYDTEGKALDDYDNILYVNRNNEMPIFNSDYLQYIKNGFNYDMKNKTRTEAGQWIGVGLSLVGAVASFASSGITHGFGIAGGISLATTALAQLTNAVNSTARAEATQNQKLVQLREQKDSVYGADDVDLLTYYSNNKAKLMRYKVSERMKMILWDLFFYTGYQCGYKGIPNYTSRTRFNFVSCELELIPVMNITEDIIKDIKTKYSAGVTFIHNVSSTWDFDQKYENWETSLF